MAPNDNIKKWSQGGKKCENQLEMQYTIGGKEIDNKSLECRPIWEDIFVSMS